MADNTPMIAASHLEKKPSSSNSEETVQLQYPTIDIAFSSDSLLFLPCQSSNASTIMPTTNESVQALDESWASFDTSDLGHEEDLQSEATDVESLVDLSSNQDTESVVEEDEQSEHEIEAATQGPTAAEHTTKPIDTSHREQQPQQHNVPSEEGDDEIIILQPSQEQQNSTCTQLEYRCELQPVPISPTGPRETIEKETLFMKISTQRLLPTDKPFHIAYYGVGSARVSRDDLLGKIGAALVSSAMLKQDTSKCYNIFPTEFGPGCKPAFAELVPSQAQMIVDSVTVLKHGPDRPKTIRFALKQGTIFESNQGVLTSGVDKAPWQPSLLVVHLCRDDLADDFYTAKQVIELSERHCWPLLVVSQDSAAGMYLPCSRDLNKEFELDTPEHPDIAENPIDLDTFLRIDTDQLNKHIKYITDAAESRLRSLHRPSNMIDHIKTFTRRLFPNLDKRMVSTNGYVLEVVHIQSKEKTQPVSKTYMRELLQKVSQADYKSALQDAVASLLIVVLGLLVVSAYQMLSQYSYRVPRIAAGISLTSATDATATVTATSAISTFIAASTGPTHEKTTVTGLDQMLQRFMGRLDVDETPAVKTVVHSQTQKEVASKDDTNLPSRDKFDGVLEAFEGFLSKIVIELEAAHGRLNVTAFKLKGRRREVRERNRQRMQDFQMHLQQLSNDVSKRSRELSQQSLDSFAELLARPQEKFTELLLRSQMLVTNSRRTSAKRINQLIEDQKTLLMKAQRQARQIVEQKEKPVTIFYCF